MGADGHSWEVICVGYREDTEHNDCRAIKEIGYLAPTLRTRKVDAVASMLDSGLSNYHLTIDGRKIPLQAAKDKYYYVRTEDEDTPDDPLLTLPTITKYKTEEKFKR